MTNEISTKTPVEQLEEKLQCRWPAIRKAESDAEAVRQRVCDLLSDNGRLVPEEEATIVVFGSLARGEWTHGSDVDWTLLIDGPADPQHRTIAHLISKRLADENLQPPGQTGVFGNMAFSHDIIHQIGGQKDTNVNMTRRILLLLESCPLTCELVYNRVIRSVLQRYLEDDISFLTSTGKSKTYKIPRFLLNDIVRFWRTMAVDYAHKRYERAGEGWALRNIKLRMSRKLIFVSGLLTCFSCYLNPSSGIKDVSEGKVNSKSALVNHLVKYVKMTPLEVLAEALDYYAPKDIAKHIMDSYNEFIRQFMCPKIRKHLENLDSSKADTDSTFNQLCNISREFQSGLTQFFFQEHRQLAELIEKYGVF